MLNNLSEELGRAQTFDDVFKVAGNLLPKIIRADQYSTTRINETGEFLEVFTLTGMEGAIPTGTELPVEQTAVGKAIHSRQPVNIPDLRKDSHIETQSLVDQGLHSTLAVPMIGTQETIGTLNFGSTHANAFSERDQDLAMQAAAQISSVLENRGLLFQTQLQAQREQTLRQITAAVRSSTDPATIMRTAVRELGTALGRNTMIRLADSPLPPTAQETDQ
jgi:GAF domain-containing protein